jgi:hypothetical protein
MAAFLLKRTKTNVNRAPVGIMGPVDETGAALPGAVTQECDFFGPDGSQANIQLTVGSRYKVAADLWGEKGGTLVLETQALGASSSTKIGTITIPQNVSGRKTHIGFYHWDTFLFTA